MGDPVNGIQSTGGPGTHIAPVLLGGLDADGTVRTLLVDTDGVIQTSASATPTLAAVVAVGNSANSHKITNLSAATTTGDAVSVRATALGVLAAIAAGGTKPEIAATPTLQGVVDALVALGLVTQAAP